MSVEYMVVSNEGNKKLLILSHASSTLEDLCNGENNLISLSNESSGNESPVQTVVLGDSSSEVLTEQLEYDDAIAAQIISEMIPPASREEVLHTSVISLEKELTAGQRRNSSPTCELCGKSFRSKSNLKRHLRSHTGERPFHCKDCNKSFVQIDHLKRHAFSHSDKNAFKCEICLKTYKEKMRYVVHMRTHTGEKPFVCTLCNKGFTYKMGLVKHTRTHTGEKRYECLYCLKRFTDSQNLRIHTRTHTGERPYPCLFCGKNFRIKKSLQVHIRTHTGERPYNCDLCWRAFVSKSGLNAHKKTHLKVFPFQCRFCDKRFPTKATLKAHIRVHLHEKPFECDVCFHKFDSRLKLVSHKESHKDLDLKCNICRKTFQMLEAYEFHMKLHEENEGEVTVDQQTDKDTLLSTLARATELHVVEYENDKTDGVDSSFPDRGNSFLLIPILEKNQLPKRQRRYSV